MDTKDTLKVGLAQISPILLNRDATLAKAVEYTRKAAEQHCHLVTFGEALIPGYPFWLERTEGVRFNSKVQKDIFARYMDQAICLEENQLEPLCKAAAESKIAVVAGIIERPLNTGGHSLYCSLVYIDPSGTITTVHRKLRPTYDERLVWTPGDGHGLRTNKLGPFTVGALNCWENWMPLPRAALYALGEDLHVAIWPGSLRNTRDITRHIAVESRSYVVSVSAMMHVDQVPTDFPHRDKLVADKSNPQWADGGSCVAAPDGTWVLEPQVGEEGLFTATIKHAVVRGERQNFDAAGHYSRPDVTKLTINRARQSTIELTEDQP